MDPIASESATPSIDPAKMSAPAASTPEIDPLVTTWFARIAASEKRWDKLHKRMRYNRKLVRGIDDTQDAETSKYNKQRANLIQSTIAVVLSKVYAKNPEMAAKPRNKARDLRLFTDTVSGVTQAMLEDAFLKKKAKATVRAAMTCSYGIVKLQYQRVTNGENDPIITQRIEDTQDNIRRIDALVKDLEDPQRRANEEATKRQLEEVLAGLQEQAEVVAAEGLVMDRVRSDRLLVDDSVEDIWEYASADWMVEKIPMRKSKAAGLFKDFDLSNATTYKAGSDTDAKSSTGDGRKQIYSPGQSGAEEDPMVMVYEAWCKADSRVYTLVQGCVKQFARKPYTPKNMGERWWPYFILPFQSVDGEFAAQSLVDVLERLQEEHNETRDKFAEVRRKIRPHFTASGDLKEKDITIMVHPEIGEIVVVNTNGQPIETLIRQATQLTVDPAVFDTGPIRNDWEMVSGLQDAARSVVVEAKTATEASISEQSLAARVAEFRDQVEDFLTEIAQCASEMCLLAMTPQQVETIMGKPTPPDPMAEAAALTTGQPPPQATPVYEWPADRKPETVFNLVQMEIRAGSTAAPNKLKAQETWAKVLPQIQQLAMVIRQIEAAGGDATAEREMAKETAARFDETIDVDRFLPPKPAPKPMMPAVPGMPGMPPGGPQLPPGDPAAGLPHMAGAGGPPVLQ